MYHQAKHPRYVPESQALCPVYKYCNSHEDNEAAFLIFCSEMFQMQQILE